MVLVSHPACTEGRAGGARVDTAVLVVGSIVFVLALVAIGSGSGTASSQSLGTETSHLRDGESRHA